MLTRPRAGRAALLTAALLAGLWTVIPGTANACPQGEVNQSISCDYGGTVPGGPASPGPAATGRGGPQTGGSPGAGSGSGRSSTGTASDSFDGPIQIRDGRFVCTAQVRTECGGPLVWNQGIQDIPWEPAAPGAAQQQVGVAPAPPVVDPQAVARTAIARLGLSAPPIRLSAPPGSLGPPPGIPVWMWLEPGPASTGPATATATDGPVTVVATATLTSVEWDMGDGFDSVICAAGTPHDPASIEVRPGEGSYTGYTKDWAGKTVTITATSNWAIHWEWTGGGAEGDEQTTTTAQVQLPVQNVTTANGVPDGGS